MLLERLWSLINSIKLEIIQKHNYTYSVYKILKILLITHRLENISKQWLKTLYIRMGKFPHTEKLIALNAYLKKRKTKNEWFKQPRGEIRKITQQTQRK